MTAFPDNWPRCPGCGDYALDGHITCGRVECNEAKWRRRHADEFYKGVDFVRTAFPRGAYQLTEQEIKKSQDNIRRLFREAGIPLADEDYK